MPGGRVGAAAGAAGNDVGHVGNALALGWTGVCLRSTGVPYDVRRSHPYLVYDRLEFDVPVGTRGDNYDRFMCRSEEMRQSARMIDQALDQMPDEGPVDIDDPRIVMPPKEEVYSTIEGTMMPIPALATSTSSRP